MRGIVEIFFLSKRLNCVKVLDASAQSFGAKEFLICLCRVENKKKKKEEADPQKEKDAGVEERRGRREGGRGYLSCGITWAAKPYGQSKKKF